jgi:hypothetical protein
MLLELRLVPGAAELSFGTVKNRMLKCSFFMDCKQRDKG